METQDIRKTGSIEVIASFKGRVIDKIEPPLFPPLLASSLSADSTCKCNFAMFRLRSCFLT